MRFETLNDCGEFGIEFENIEGPSSRIIKEFLKDLLNKTIKRCVNYYEQADEHVFTYKERQLHSVLCPAIADITNYFLIENPLNRKPAGETEYRGSVDYWIYYKGYSFLIELKHSFFAYSRADYPRKSITKRFMDAQVQLENIRKRESWKQTAGDGLRKIALEVIVFYRSSKKESQLKHDIEHCDFKMLFTKLLTNTDLNEKSNMHALWLLDDELLEPYEFPKIQTFEVYPAVAFIGHVSELYPK